MLILLDCRPLQQDPDSEKSRFIISCVKLLSGEQGFEWLLLADTALDTRWLPAGPGFRLLTRRSLPGKGGWKWWYDGRIPLTAKRYKPDLVLTTAGLTAARMQAPQGMWMPERTDGKGRIKKNYSGFYRKRLTASLQQARVIFSFSEKEKEYLISQAAGATVADKILVIPPAAGERPFVTPEEKEKIKQRYTEGKEYFFAAAGGAGQGEIVELLKAFSLFKKRQRSNMQFVLTGKDPVSDKALGDLLSTYKYRADVHWAGLLSAEDEFRLAAASYAHVFPFGRDTLGTGILDAWKAGVPVITTDRTCLPQGEDTLLYAQPGEPAALAGQLMLIYKDERQRYGLIAQGAKQGEAFSLHRSAGLVGAGITGALTALSSKMSKSAIKN